MFEDSRPLTETERLGLCHMLSMAMLEIRLFGYEGKAEQAAYLADAFHNVPIHLFGETFSFRYFRLCMYDSRQRRTEPGFDYLEMLDKLLREEGGRG